MKKVDFKQLSGHVCCIEGCQVRIKQNIVNRKPTANKFYCFNHFMAIVRKHLDPRYNKYRN